MGIIKIQQQALCLHPLELAELITTLNQALEQKLRALLQAPEETGCYLKEIILAGEAGCPQNQEFILEDFLGYEQGKLYLACTPEGNCTNYVLFTIHVAGVERLVTINANPKTNWREKLTPHIINFFGR